MKKGSILLLIILILSACLFSSFSYESGELKDSQRQPWSLIK